MRPRMLLTLAATGFLAAALPLRAQTADTDQGAAAAPAAPMNREQVEAVVRDYILANPEIVVQALDAFRAQKDEETRQAQLAAVDNLSPQIFSSASSPVLGNPDGDVTLVEFFDYQCGYCKRMEPVRIQLLAEDPNLRMIMKEFPILGPASITASRATLAAERQGRYRELHEALMAFRGTLTDDIVYQTAESLGLDMKTLRADMDDPAIAEEVRANMDLAQSLGIGGTPAYVINGQVVPGAVGYDRIKAEIEAERGS